MNWPLLTTAARRNGAGLVDGTAYTTSQPVSRVRHCVLVLDQLIII
jgi:hypothetical protein